MMWLDNILAIVVGLAFCIPLVIAVVNKAQEAIQERNWNTLLKMVMAFMVEAEKAFDNGYERKEFVMGQLDAAAAVANYVLTAETRARISDMIDSLCEMAHSVNGRE